MFTNIIVKIIDIICHCMADSCQYNTEFPGRAIWFFLVSAYGCNFYNHVLLKGLIFHILVNPLILSFAEYQKKARLSYSCMYFQIRTAENCIVKGLPYPQRGGLAPINVCCASRRQNPIFTKSQADLGGICLQIICVCQIQGECLRLHFTSLSRLIFPDRQDYR
jgi:hypothetical protein